MSNEVTIKVTGRNDANPALDTAAKSVGKLGEATGFVQKRADELKTKIKDLTTQLDRLGTDGSQSIEDIEIAQVKLRKEIRGAESDLISFERILKGMAGEATSAGIEIGGELAGSAVKVAGTSLRGALPAVIGAAVVAAVPVAGALGAMIGGALVGGVGIGGMVGGIVAAAQDSRVKAAWDVAVKSMASDGVDLGKPFVGPLVQSIELLRRGVGGLLDGELGASVKGLAPHVTVLAKGFVDLAERAAPGLSRMLQTAGPVLDALADELPEIGDAISEMLTDIADDPDQAVAGIRTLSFAIQETTRFVGDLVSSLMDVYEISVEIAAPIAEVGAKVLGWLPFFGDYMERNAVKARELADSLGGDKPAKFNTHMQDIAGTTAHAAVEMDKLARAIDDVFDPIMDLDKATLRYEMGLISLQKELTNGARTLAINTEEGQRNRSGILDQIQTIKDLRDASATVPEKVDEANAAYARQLEALRGNLIALGYNKEQVNQLIDAYKNLPSEVTIDFRFPGLLDAIAAAYEAKALFGSFAAGARARDGDDSGTLGGYAHGGIVGAASGGARGGMVMVGEQGRELVNLPYGSTVIPNGTTEAMMSAGGGGSGSVRVVFEIVGGDDDFRRFMQRNVKVHGDGNVEVAYGTGSA